MLQLPMLLVLVGHKLSSQAMLEARLSWSACELLLMIAAKFSVDVRQGYIAAKYVLKSSLEKLRKADASGDGRSHVGSYHIKTVFLHVVEKGSKKKSLSLNSSPYELFSNLLRELDSYIEKGKLPHFFLPQCDLLETVGDEERRLTRQAIENILTVPFDAIIHSPIDAKQIFGDVSKNDLVLAFSRASADPTSELNQKDLSGLLARVDDWRERMGREQLGEVGQASGPARWDLADVDHKTQNIVSQIPCCIS